MQSAAPRIQSLRVFLRVWSANLSTFDRATMLCAPRAVVDSRESVRDTADGK